MGVPDEDGINGFRVFSFLTDEGYRLLDGCGIEQLDIFRGHDRPSGVFAIPEQLVDVRPHVFVGGLQDFVGEIRWQVSNRIGHVVGALGIDDLNQVAIGHRGDDFLFGIGGEVIKEFRGIGGFDVAENINQFFGG